ncbi:myeloid cell surface antigen CD33 isoform X1 [Mus caroli]|uniref:Myeloid cell surface antigen CD33 isoform X1 n=1 Tax=Mus caroli TaxID=10089 RepID=A0A6P7RD08_MUSCR|nr:myeloid cell surface antigen CD33 isoform X1 [Mus caroli]
MLWPLLLLLLCAGSLAQDLEFQLVAPESVTVEEGLCVHVPCSVFYPSIKLTLGPVTGSWLRKGVSLHEDSPVATSDPRQLVQKATQGRFQLLGDPQKHDCSLLIRDAQKNDTGMYFFRVVREPFVRYSYKKSQLSLHVTSLSRTPDIIIPGTLEAGYPSNLTCSVPWACEQGTPPTFSWMSTALTSLSSRTANSSVLTFTPQPQDHGTKLTCLVTFSGAGVTVERTIQLNVTRSSAILRIQDPYRRTHLRNRAVSTLRLPWISWEGSLRSTQRSKCTKLCSPVKNLCPLWLPVDNSWIPLIQE